MGRKGQCRSEPESVGLKESWRRRWVNGKPDTQVVQVAHNAEPPCRVVDLFEVEEHGDGMLLSYEGIAKKGFIPGPRLTKLLVNNQLVAYLAANQRPVNDSS